MKIVLVFLLTYISSVGFAKGWEPGYWLKSTGDTVWGEVKWRNIDVPRKAMFRDSTQKEVQLKARNTLEFGSETSAYKRIIFTELQLGWPDSFFMEVKQTAHAAELLYGKIMSKGCGCDGAKYIIEHKWVLVSSQGIMEVVEENRWGRITNAETIGALLLAQGYRIDPLQLEKIDDLKELLVGATF